MNEEEFKQLVRLDNLNGQLTPFEERFVVEYVNCGIPSKALRIMGYNELEQGAVSTQRLASNLMKKPSIKAAIEKRRNQIAAKMDLTQERVMEEISKIAFADISEIMEIDDEGNVNIKRFDLMDPNSRAAISDIASTMNKNGHVVRVKKHDKLQALQMLAKMMGFAGEQKHEHKMVGADGETYVPIQIMLPDNKRVKKPPKPVNDIDVEKEE